MRAMYGLVRKVLPRYCVLVVTLITESLKPHRRRAEREREGPGSWSDVNSLKWKCEIVIPLPN